MDEIFVDLWHDYDRVCASETTYLGYRWLTAALSISAHGPHGRVTGALPDGRLAGVTLADGVLSATPGTDTNGPIALIKSGVKLDPTEFRSVQLNMKFHPNAIRGAEGSRNFVDFIKSYFDMGGYHVQFNIVDSNMLRDAPEAPLELPRPDGPGRRLQLLLGRARQAHPGRGDRPDRIQHAVATAPFHPPRDGRAPSGV